MNDAMRLSYFVRRVDTARFAVVHRCGGVNFAAHADLGLLVRLLR